MKYNIKKIENKWYKKNKKFNFFIINKKSKKKFYILNMFPYPSGYGLHIGHSIGYIFSDIIAKYKSSLGYKILNPIGFDSFGLPAEQYAINTGNHPKKIIYKSIKKYLKQIKLLGVFFNWKKIINTSNKNYYKWTQWIFIKLFNSYYDKKKNKALNIKFLKKKNKNKYRLAYLKNNYINWCPKLNSVLANDEIKNGKSIRGGYKIIPKKMKQWHLRITKYNKRLLYDLNLINWPKHIKNIQKNWIGKKKIYFFNILLNKKKIKIFTKKKNYKNIRNIIFNYPSKYIDYFLNYIKKKKKIINLLNNYYYNLKIFKILIKIKVNNNKKIKFFISNYYNNYFIKNVYINFKKDIKFNKIKNNLVLKIKQKIYLLNNFKNIKIYNLNDIIFSRQRYWGEPIPIYYKNKLPYNINIKNLPLKLPKIKKKYFLNNKNILKNYKKWAYNIKKNIITYNYKINNKNIFKLDINTMPSYAGSNWYYLRYIDPNYKKFLINKKKILFWKNVDLYIGGIEHINGHLLYSRFCNKFLYDLKIINFKEPFKNFINQGTILNKTYIIYILNNYLISYDLINNYKKYKLNKIYINKKYIFKKNIVNYKKFKKKFINYKFKKNKNNKFLCNIKLEKMSKSKYNIITPDSIIKKYGLDCFRLYIIFLGPFNKKKIWNLDKIKGIIRFLNKIFKYYLNNNNNNKKINKKYIIKIENYIFKLHKNFKMLFLHKNISLLMEIYNFLIKKKIFNIKIKKKFLIFLSFYIPCLTEYIWKNIGYKKSIYYQKIKIKNYNILYIKYLIFINNKKKNIINIKKKNNNLKYIMKQIYKRKILNNEKIKKIIFIKNKILNILIN
ncbi:MAG: class I tRNA ligase family protein [Candidatus Shikimatogenerans sp. JK-2022]|nr:class I tRNA ligase family protein [Candidatus Shikimatogenerans bostrichidophilus]